MKPLVELFKKWALETHNADVDVEWIYASTSDNFARIQAERENPQADILTTTGDRSMAAKEMGLTEPYKVSNWDEIPDFAKDKDGHWWAPSLLPYIILYNKDLVSEEEAPKDWVDVLDPKWKGQLIVRDPTQSGTGGTIVLSFMAVWGPEQGKDFLLRLDNQVEGRYHESSTKTVLDVARGAYKMALWNEAYTLRVKYDQGFSNLGVVYPKSWMVMGLETRLIPKGAPHRKAAELWMEFEATPLAAIDMMKQYDRPTLAHLVPPDQVPEWLKESQNLPVLNINWAKFTTARKEWLNMWSTEIKGKGADYVAANPEVPEYVIVDDYLVK
ncbi:MAG TPA: extracellular solute-binding protein [Anaerolineae bacterium]|nr:extracellular solute-binding protein [Anaerolineae bacterium]